VRDRSRRLILIGHSGVQHLPADRDPLADRELYCGATRANATPLASPTSASTRFSEVEVRAQSPRIPIAPVRPARSVVLAGPSSPSVHTRNPSARNARWSSANWNPHRCSTSSNSRSVNPVRIAVQPSSARRRAAATQLPRFMIQGLGFVGGEVVVRVVQGLWRRGSCRRVRGGIACV
jgi:hypothetical protein